MFSVSGSEAISRGIKGFNEVVVTDSCICAVFDGTTFEERVRAFRSDKELPDGGQSVYVFGFEGNPLKKMKLDHSVLVFP